MSRTISISDTKSYNLTSYDEGYVVRDTSSNLGNACDGDDSTYAQINFVTGSNAETYIYYNFGGISLPTGATDISVSCSVKIYLSNTANLSARTIQLYSGTTEMGTAFTVAAGTATASLTTGTWTAAQLANAKLKLYAKRATSATTTSRYYRIYNATLTVSYTYEQTQYEVTATSNSPSITVSSAQAWVNAGEDYDLDITGDITNADITDNNSDIKSSLSVIGTNEYRYGITSISSDHAIVITEVVPAGDTIYIKVNGTWKEAQDVKVKINGSWQSVSKAYKKVNGAWDERDKSAMFDNNALYLKG